MTTRAEQQVTAFLGMPLPVVVQPDGTITPVSPQDGHGFSLKEMQDCTGGGFEPVHLDRKTVMVVHDMGLIIGLPLNPKASAIYHHFGGRDAIAGPVLLCRLSSPGLDEERWF